MKLNKSVVKTIGNKMYVNNNDKILCQNSGLNKSSIGQNTNSKVFYNKSIGL